MMRACSTGLLRFEPSDRYAELDGTSGPAGSASVSVAPFAVPVPVLLTHTLNPIVPPATTLAASAFFTIVRLGQSTVVVALAATVPKFVALALALLGYAAQL